MKLLGIGKVSTVKPLNEDVAVDLAAEMLGEFVIFSIAAALLFAEYKRQQYKDQIKVCMIYDDNLSCCNFLAIYCMNILLQS